MGPNSFFLFRDLKYGPQFPILFSMVLYSRLQNSGVQAWEAGTLKPLGLGDGHIPTVWLLLCPSRRDDRTPSSTTLHYAMLHYILYYNTIPLKKEGARAPNWA